MTALPTPEQWVIKRMSLEETAEMIERHIDFVDEDGRSVHLPTNFVRHYWKRNDGVLPAIAAVTTMPIVLADAGVIGREEGLDRLRGIVFRTQPEVGACVPQPGAVTDNQVRRAMELLTDQWLIDVAADYAGKCTIIAAALTIIERSLLDQRPTFFVTAGRRGGGKTTTLVMLIKAVTGVWPAAAAWSPNEEERRKALLSYFLYGVPYILWDNIARGTRISCPHIERSCTAAYYADRKLGVSEMVATAASTIHLFTGNNIGPRGDLASRSLLVHLKLDRHDPENREFKHPDPIGWTDDMRSEILSAFYTILLGNPTLKKPRDAPMKTRFKMWWRLVGSAIEHAATLAADAHKANPALKANAPAGTVPPEPVDFQKLFLARDDDDDDNASLADALVAMRRMWPDGGFTAADVAQCVNAEGDADGAILREFLYAKETAKPTGPCSAVSVGVRLRNHVDDAVKTAVDEALVLRSKKDRTGLSRFSVVDPKVMETLL